jgi:hypothetical protein
MILEYWFFLIPCFIKTMNLTNQELRNDDRNAEAAELVRDFCKNLLSFPTRNLFAALVLIDMFSSETTI